MPDNVDKLFEIMQAKGAASDRGKFRKVFLTPGNKGYKIRKDIYDGLRADGIIDSPTYEDFRRKLRLGGTPTVNKYRQQMFSSVDPNKSRASELTHRAVGQAVRATNNVRKPVTAKVVNRKGKPTGEEFAITPAKTVEDLDREYAQETTKNWENELNDQMADADKDAAKISDMFKSFIGSTDEVGSVWGNMTRGGGIAGTPHSVTTNNGILENTEARQILAAGDYNRKRRELLQLEQDSRNGAIFDNHSFFRGMYDAAKDTGFLTGGASDLINAGSLLATKQDLDNGVHTEAGDMLMQQAVKNSDAQSQYGDNQGWMYTGGVITTNMAPFMMQVASAGFSKGMSNAIGKVVQGAASKVALGTMEKATGMAGAHIANYIGKVTGLTTKAFGKAIQYGIVGAAQANTVGLGNVANDVINRYTGQVYQDEKGNYKFGTFDSDGKLVHEGGEDFLTALVKGDAAQTIEFATELAGGGIDAVGTALKNFVSKGGKKIINKYNMENVSKVIDFLLNNKVSKNARYLKAGADRTLGKVELNSIVGESLEEELGIIANTVFTGDNKISDLWDEKQQSQIWGGMLLSIGLMKGAVAPFHAYNAKQYYSYKHKLDKADVNLSQLLGKEKWEELRNQIDATTNDDMPEMVNKINRDVALGKNRQPVREYIQNLLIMRGYDIGNMLAAKKAVEDKGECVSVKNMEKNQAYQQGRDVYGYDTHEIQLDQEDKQKSLAQLLGISEQQLASMSDEELEALSSRDDNIDRAIYDYQLSTARYEGVIDNARDQIDLEVQRAAQAVDMYTDKSRNTIRNATIKATGGLEDYGVYIINGNIATHEDGSIDISNSDDMILYYDPTTNTVEHADAMMFAELGSEENADEVRSQAMDDAKEKAIKETTGIIDGVVEVGTQFKTVDADGTEHTYEVLADNGDGTAVVTIDGNVPTELVKGENVQVPFSFEELQKMKDASDQQRLQAAKAQREQMEKERAEQQMQAQTTQAENPSQEDNIQPAPIEDNLDYSDIIREDGKVQMVDVSDKDGNNLFPDAKDVFYIQGNKMRTKFAYIDANGELKTQSFPTGLVKIKTRGEVSVDDYKKYRATILSAESSTMPETSMIEDNSGTIEANRGGVDVEDNTQPLSEADADNVIAQMESSAETAPDLELTPDNWTAEFGEDGILSTPIGDVKMGENQVAKLFEKGRSKEFGMIKPTLTNPDVIIEVPSHSADGNEERSSSYLFIKTFLGKNGKKVYYFKSVTIKKDGLEISISSHYDRVKRVKEALMKGKLLYRKNDGAQTEQNQPSTSVTTSQEDAAGSSESKDTNISSNGNENNESLTFEDGTPIPVDMNGEVDLSQTDASHAAEWYDNNLGEDADDWLDGEIKKAKKVLEQAKNKKLAGTKPSELVASKKEKEAAIADAQAHYDSAISIRDSLKERRIAKEENTADGRRNLIEKARRKFARLKSAVKDDAEAVSQLYRETIGSLLHRLYDGTGIDVTDTIPLTAEEYVASNLGAHSLNYEGTETSKGVKQETGLSREDFAKTQLLAADGKGTTIDALVHSLWENLPSNLESLDTQDIRNALIGVLNSGFKASEARNFVENIRIAQADNILEEQKRAQENAAYAEQHKAEPEAELKAKSDEKAELKAKSEAKLDNESDNESNDLSNETDNEQKNDNINDNINVPEDATDEAPLGAQRDESDLPFSAKENGKQQTTAERAADVEKNKVDDMKVVDNIVGEKTRKTLEKLAKMMGANVQWQYSDKNANGWFDDKTNTIYLTLDSSITEGVQFIFGHEMTHEMRTKNPAAYDELKTLVKDMMGEDAFNSETDRITSLYNENNVFYNGGRTAYEEEVVADQLGKWIRDANYAHTLLLKMSHPLLAKLHEIVNRFLMALHGIEISDDMNLILRSIEQAYVKTAKGEITNSETGEDVSFSLRQKPEPKKKGVGYKVFVLKDGKLYPPMVANPNGAATPVGVWLDADAAPIAGESKTGRPQVKQGGKGTQGGSGKLAYRPGWHLGVVPYAIQFNRKDAEGNKTLFPKNFVFAEVEYAADVDYQEEARQEGINPSGKYQHSLAGLKHLPTDGYYMYRTNPNPETDPWVITGAMKVNRILTRAEQAELVKNAGREPQQIQEGDIVTDDVVNSINQEIADAPKFSLKDNQENPLNQDGTLKLDKIKSVDELTDEDFTSAFRNVELPAIPKNVDAAIGANGKPIVIKKNIFEKNWNAHKFTPAESKKVLNDALYNTDLVGHTQPTKKPNHWVAIKLDDKSPITVLEVNDNKNNVEVVGWYTLDERNLGRIKRQAERNGGELIMLTPKDDKVESLSTPPLSSAAKIDNSSETAKENGEKFSLKDEKIKSVAEKFGVNEDDVAMYANAVEKGSTAEAARARANIKRYLLQANEDKISSFKELMKYTVTVNESLKENFGDLDAMIEERRKQVEAERNAMEAARKRAQEEEEKRQKHLDELSLIPTDELDKRYMDAIANNDESTAREMLDESARRNGYGDVDSDYQGQGAWAAPSNPQYESDEARRADIENSPDVNLEDIALGYSLQPDDYFDNPRAYMNNTAYGLESAHVIKNALDAIKNGEKDVKVKVYRAVPTSVKEGKLRNGDWVTPSKKYAEMHGDNRLEGKYRIIEDEVPANQLWWDGNDANEFGFDDGKEYRYKNAKNNRKLNDIITYDNKGNVIPPSKRFNSRKNDIRFSLAGERGAADMAEDLKSLNTPDEVDDAIKTAIDDMPSGWKMANKKMIHIVQALGENRKAEIAGEEPKFSLKDGTLIKAGTYFSGGGLVEEGLKGIIDPVVAVEYDEKISGVYRNNFGQHIVTADVRDVDPKELVKQIDGDVEYFHASPVCKNYSQAKSNHAEVELDKETAASTAEFINAVKPKVVTIENVKGYKDSDAMKIITDALDANGYTWDADVYNAADYGGYTNRERLIVRAVRDGKLPAKPEKMARKSGWYEAVADIIPTLTEKKNGVAPWMDVRLKADGIDWRNIDKPLYVMGSAYADGKVPHAFADELLPTLRTKSGDVIVMPDGKVYRAMGRVLARVSGVSDDYKMPFSESLSHTIIGNGIPTQLTEHVIAPLLTGSDPKFSIRTYHGTGASFDKFDLSHALEGEGSETFGHGVYVTNSSKIGREYAQRAKQRKMADLYKNMRYPDGVKDDIFKRRVFGEMVNDVATGGSVASAKEFAKKRVGADANDIQRTLENLKDREKGTEYEQNLKDRLAEYKDALKWIDSIDEDYLTQGNANRYDVDIPDDNGNYLGWNDSQNFPLEKWYRLWEITHHGFNENEYFKDGGARYDKDRIERIIQMKLDSPENGMQRLPTLKGEELYHALEDFFDRERPSHGAELASRALSEIGFVGIKYPAGLIHGGAEEGDYNYVIFDENNANIVGNTKFSLRGSTPYDKQMEEWMEKNHLEKGAVPMEKPIMKEGENIFDYANRMVEWTRNQNLWKTAPKQTGFQDALDKWKADNGLSPDAYPPVRPHRENYSTEIGYAEDLEEYNKKKELWKSAPKPKDFDLSVDLEDMNKQLRNIRRAVLNQKNYDQRTVKAVSDLVRKMLNIGWGDGLSRGKVGNLLSAAKNATGANDVKKYLDKAMGILAENYLNRLSTAYDNLINTKGARADQSGVIKMGSLDANGQAFMSEYKKAINMDDSSLNTYIANIEEDSAKNEDNVEMNDYRLAGIQAAIMYKQQIGGNDADIAELKRQIGELKNKKAATKEDKDLLKSLEKKLFENKFDRITMYENLLNNIQRMVKESKGRAKEFREEITEHKNEILHRANLDLEGVDSTYYDTTTAKKKLVNNDLQRAVFSSTYTFEQFLKFFGKKAANGEGYLYNYFTKLNQDALDEEQLYNEMNRNALDEKTKELFGKEKFMKLVGIDGKGMKEMDIEVTDYSNKETGKRTIHLKQGQMLYIYLVNKETDGEMKLRAMGITEEDVAAIEENLDPRVKAMGEWLQDEYLPECQRRYQATHTKYFGAPMKEVENYFPLAINNRARNVKEDVNQDSDAMSQLAGTSTGAIVTRRVNVIPLDIENADAFEVAFNHLQEMEEWSAMLPFRQDINTLLSYTHFRNKVQNMSSVAYGSGKTLWDEFKQTAQIAAGTYKPKVNAGMMDSRIAAAMGGIAVAKISGRLWTAIKQSQSATVFLPECDFTRFVKNGVNPYGSWKWAMENIPDFRKRVENMTYGDVKLRQYLDELEKWHDWTKTISKIGMAPNILVDGITCAVGARSVYETEVNRLSKLGYPKEKAEEKAYYKAVAAYNKTQQSSGGMYLSPMQVDRTYVSAALSLFKNANYAYGRMQIEACRGLARTYDLWGGKHKTTLIESMTRQIMEEDGLDENTARAIAKATYNRTFRQSIGRLINFATLVPVSWALYKVLPYLLTGDDDDKKKDMIEEAVLKGFATSLSDNYVIPFASNILNAGLKVEDGKPTFDPEVFRYQNLYINPATSDLANIYSMVGNQKWYSVANKLGMLGVQSLIGFNPETVGALYQAVSEADYDNGNTAKEWQIGILKAISAPEESIRELYMDELGLKSGDIKKIPLAELEKRYAERQINRDNLLSQIVMDAETFNGYVDKYQKSFEKKIKDKMDKWDEYDKKKADEFFDTTSDPKLKDMIEKKRTKDANAAADEQIAKEGLNQEKKGKEPSEEAYDAVKMSIDVAEDNAISTYNKVLNKRYAALNDEYNNQTDAMKYIFMSKHPNFKSYKDLESEYTTYGKKMKELKEKLVSADGYDAKQTILKQIRVEREKFSELQSKVR